MTQKSWLSKEKFAGRGETSLKSAAAELIARADEARDRRDWPSAAQDYAAAIEAGDSRPGHQVQLGHALKELGDFTGAEVAYRTFLGQHPLDADIHLQLGHLFNKMDDPKTALEWYQRAAKLAPLDQDIAQHAQSARRRVEDTACRDDRRVAMVHVEKREWRKARALLHDLVNIEGQDDLIGILANVTKETGAFEEAAELYERYRFYAQTQANVLLPDAELQIGHFCKVSGDYAGALRHYGRARAHQHEQTGHVADDDVCNREIRACLSEIYTCFWDGRSRGEDHG